MITLRPAADRGRSRFSWLDSRHSFSFGDYHDPAHMGFRALRVINEDWVDPSAGFPTHPHRDMEIITYVLEGALTHEDSSGGKGTLRPGILQRMSAGTGIAHSEYNASSTETLHLLQIWLLPNIKGLPPSYEEQPVNEAPPDGWLSIARPEGGSGVLTIRADASVHAAVLAPGGSATYALAPGRYAWLQLARGTATLNGVALQAGDGVSITDETSLELVATDTVEALLFDLG